MSRTQPRGTYRHLTPAKRPRHPYGDDLHLELKVTPTRTVVASKRWIPLARFSDTGEIVSSVVFLIIQSFLAGASQTWKVGVIDTSRTRNPFKKIVMHRETLPGGVDPQERTQELCDKVLREEPAHTDSVAE